LPFAILPYNPEYGLLYQSCSRIFKLQKKAIRIISFPKNNTPTDPLFYQLGILPLEKIITLNKLLFMHAIAYNYNLESFNNIWTTNNLREMDMELRNANDFTLPIIRREILRKSPMNGTYVAM
jgi:hypothetical protein